MAGSDRGWSPAGGSRADGAPGPDVRGTIAFVISSNRQRDGYEIASLFPRPRGTWSWDSRGKNVAPQVLPGKTTPAVRRQIRLHADALTHTLRVGLNADSRRAA